MEYNQSNEIHFGSCETKSKPTKLLSIVYTLILVFLLSLFFLLRFLRHFRVGSNIKAKNKKKQKIFVVFTSVWWIQSRKINARASEMKTKRSKYQLRWAIRQWHWMETQYPLNHVVIGHKQNKGTQKWIDTLILNRGQTHTHTHNSRTHWPSE